MFRRGIFIPANSIYQESLRLILVPTKAILWKFFEARLVNYPIQIIVHRRSPILQQILSHSYRQGFHLNALISTLRENILILEKEMSSDWPKLMDHNLDWWAMGPFDVNVHAAGRPFVNMSTENFCELLWVMLVQETCCTKR